MSQSETYMLIILGFAIATFLALIIGRLAWMLALRIGARRANRNVPTTVAALRTERDRLRAEHAMMATKLELRVDAMKMRLAEQLAEVSRHRNRVENLMQDLAKRDARITEHEGEIAALRVSVASLRSSLSAREAELLEATKLPELVVETSPFKLPQPDAVQDKLQSRISELTSLSEEISKERDGAPVAMPPLNGGVLVKPADSTTIHPEILETKIIAAERAANQLQDELKRLEEAWPDPATILPAEGKRVEEPPKRGITNVVSLAKRIKALQKNIVN